MERLWIPTCLVMCLVAAGPLSGQQVVLDVPLFPQLTGNWCWAASEEMISTFLGHGVGQCEQVNEQSAVYQDWGKTKPNCCPASEDAKCQFGSWPWFDSFTYRRTASGKPLSWEELTQEIGAGRPVGFSWKWNTGGGHMMVARGFSAVPPGWVQINDPYYPKVDDKILGDVRWITYADYVSRPDDHTHWFDFYDVRYQEVAEAKTADQPSEAPIPKPPAPPGTKEPREAAARALEMVRALLSGGREEIGFKSVKEVDEARLGEPIPVFYIWLDALKRYRRGDDLHRLLTDGQELIYPIEVGGEMRSLIVVKENQGLWHEASVGSPVMVQALEKATPAHAAESGQPLDSLFVLHIPALYEVFIGHWRDGELFLSPLDDQAFAGKRLVQPAGKLLKNLAAVARKNEDGLGVPVGDD